MLLNIGIHMTLVAGGSMNGCSQKLNRKMEKKLKKIKK